MRRRIPSRQSQAEADESDTIPIPFEELNVNEPIAQQKSEEFYVQSTIFQSNSWSKRNESIRNKSITRRNQFLSRRRTKQSITGRNTTGNSRHSSSRVSEASHGNESTTDDRVGLDPSLLIKDVVDSPIVTVSGGGASTSDDSGSRKVLVIEKGGKAQMRFVRVSFVL
jgi:hypothetical protein